MKERIHSQQKYIPEFDDYRDPTNEEMATYFDFWIDNLSLGLLERTIEDYIVLSKKIESYDPEKDSKISYRRYCREFKELKRWILKESDDWFDIDPHRLIELCESKKAEPIGMIYNSIKRGNTKPQKGT